MKKTIKNRGGIVILDKNMNIDDMKQPVCRLLTVRNNH